MRIEEVSERLHVSIRRVRQLVEQKRIPHVRRGGRILFPKDAWEAWEKAQVRQALANCGMGGSDAA